MIIFQLLPFTCTFPSLPTQYLDEETVEQFEDRVLNKRAAQVGIFSHLSTWNFLTTTTRRHALDGPLITFQTLSYHLFIRTPLIPVALSAEAKNGGDSSSRVRLYYQVSIKILQLSNWRKNKVKNGGQLIKFWICDSRRKDTRKIAAQKFYSLLVLQKVCVLILHLKWNSCFISPHPWNIPLVQFMAVELAQDDACYGRMQVSRGKQVEWQYGGKSVVKLLELAIWCRVWCLLRTVCHLVINF